MNQFVLQTDSSINSRFKRPNSARKFNLNLAIPPPILQKTPSKKLRKRNKYIQYDREKLYENNMQLKDIINNLKMKLAETRNQLVKKDIEIRKKERLIKECSKVNDIKIVHKMNIEKAKETTLLSNWRDKYNELKKINNQTIEENNILKANIKLTNLKDCKNQINALKAEMDNLRNSYLNVLNDNKRIIKEIEEYQELKDKFLERHNIINDLVLKCEKYNNDIKLLTEENSTLNIKLENNLRQEKILKCLNKKLKIGTQKMLKQKKRDEYLNIKEENRKKSIDKLEKEIGDYKDLLNSKRKESQSLSDKINNLRRNFNLIKNNEDKIEPFDYNKVKVIERKKDTNDTNQLSLYKSLLEENKQKIKLYESYFKKIGIDKEQLMKEETIQNINNLKEGKKLSKIEEEKQDDEENQLMSLFHVFLKNLEANMVTKEVINQKIIDIAKFFEDKSEASKEEFIEPFQKMFIETMKIVKEEDIKKVNNFLNYFIESINGETSLFFNGLNEVFENIKDYSNINKDEELSFILNKYKDELLTALKKYDINNNKIITFETFRKVVQEVNLELDDEIMEYLIYLMKKTVPENNSIFSLNYEIIEELISKNEIGELFNKIKNYINKNKINLDEECKNFLKENIIFDKKVIMISKDNLFNIIGKFINDISEENKNSIYEIFKIEIDKYQNELLMDYGKIKEELQ